ncbi:MAG: hypothetical protein JWO45_207 [Spartobacteria bacterium]|nr:hypothetical protein [Spartobacteria bacterium]
MKHLAVTATARLSMPDEAKGEARAALQINVQRQGPCTMWPLLVGTFGAQSLTLVGGTLPACMQLRACGGDRR